MAMCVYIFVRGCSFAARGHTRAAGLNTWPIFEGELYCWCGVWLASSGWGVWGCVCGEGVPSLVLGCACAA
jgi:hypothetical protein